MKICWGRSDEALEPSHGYIRECMKRYINIKYLVCKHIGSRFPAAYCRSSAPVAASVISFFRRFIAKAYVIVLFAVYSGVDNDSIRLFVRTIPS